MAKVTPLTAQRAFATIKIVARAVLDEEKALTYSELARRLEMPNETGRGLGAILDEAAIRCKKHGLPNVTALIVTKASFESGKPMPSDDSFNSEGVWILTGMHRDDVPDEQEKVRGFDWLKIRALNLADESNNP